MNSIADLIDSIIQLHFCPIRFYQYHSLLLPLLSSRIFFLLFICNMDQQQPLPYICIIGNDGTGKSTMCRLVTEKIQFIGVQRSMKQSQDQNVKKLVKQIKMLDKLTYSYAFQDDWYNFDISRSVEVEGKKVKVHWVMLSAPVQTLRRRIDCRPDITIYEHQKCIRYFNYVYEQMGYFYGINIVNCNQPIEKVLEDIIKSAQKTNQPPAIKNITINDINSLDLEHEIQANISESQADQVYVKVIQNIHNFKMNRFYFPTLNDFLDISLKKKLVARWIKNHCSREYTNTHLIFKYRLVQGEGEQMTMTVPLKSQYFVERIIEGESKILFRVISNNELISKRFENKVIIILKSTIYSHTKQRTSEITDLGKVRAKGSMVFLEMLKRNNIKHSYICINRDGIILSRLVDTNMLEIVFKKQRLGTDKHSYIGMQQFSKICESNNCYAGGIYVRFDWRNPNHVLRQIPDYAINQDIYYYIVEKAVGKQIFFSKFVVGDICIAVGDKCVTEDLISNYTDTKKIKQMVIQAYCTFQYYAHEVGLQILDGCMMIDSNCDYIWSQINPDCLRVKTIKEREDYDKDIWRAGGSSSKQQIMKKWQTFNQIFITYFTKNRFMDSQMKQQLLCKQLFAKQILSSQQLRPQYQHYYNNLNRGSRQRQVIATIDIINGQPILVQSSVFKEKHSQGRIQQALQYISIMPKILVVDIDGASGKLDNNKKLIKSLTSKPNTNLFAVGGGIRTIQTAKQYLQKFEYIVISSNLDLINDIELQKRKRVIVQLSINQNNQVLTHARTVNTGVNIIKKMMELSNLGIKSVSITFNSSEGKLQGIPREQLRKIMYQIPGPIQKVIIAGGISNIEDVQFIWGFPKCVPQLGSAIWKRKIKLGDIYSRIVRFGSDGLVPAVIQDNFSKNLGVVYLNKEALQKTCEERYLYRYSRQHKKLMKKGQQSGNTQKLLSINIDCDNDSLLITVDTEHPTFCHLNTKSCFYQDSIGGSKMNLQEIQSHILKTKNGGGSGYSYKIQNNPKMAMSKVLQQCQQLSLAENKDRKMEQCADVMAHLMMFMNSEGIRIQQVSDILNERSKKQKKVKQPKSQKQNTIRIGIAAGKHTKFIFEFLQNNVGIKILPHVPGKQRNYTINYEIVKKDKFNNLLKIQEKEKDRKIIFMSVKPKDLTKLMQKGYIQFGINYSNVVENSCDQYSAIVQAPVVGLRLALIKRKGEVVNVKQWTQANKGTIISEYPVDTVKYLNSQGITSNNYSLIHVSGHSQGFLSDCQFDYCDAIVLSGKTIQDNQLEIQTILREEIKVIFFSLVS